MCMWLRVCGYVCVCVLVCVCACVCGLCVSVRALLACVCACVHTYGACVSEQTDYEVAGDCVKGDNHHGPRSARLSTSPLLDRCAFASVGVSPDMSKSEFPLLSLFPLLPLE